MKQAGCLAVLLLAGIYANPAHALWGETAAWIENGNVLKIRMAGWTGMQIPGFGDPISASTGWHAYVIGLEEPNGKLCAITAWHCLAGERQAYGDGVPQVAPSEQQVRVSGDIGLIRLTDDAVETYALVERVVPAVGDPVLVVGRTQEDGLPGRSVACRGEITAVHSGQVDDGFEVDLIGETCGQRRSATGFSFDSGSLIVASGGALRRVPCGGGLLQPSGRRTGRDESTICGSPAGPGDRAGSARVLSRAFPESGGYRMR